LKTDRPKSPTKFYTIEQIAETVGSCERTVRRWIKKKLVVAHSFDGMIRISDEDFQAFLITHRDD
jgi:excisionase family DNA binding protein